MGTKCPTCGREDFSSKKGMRTHHKLSHGESLKVSLSCDFCDSEFEVLPYRVENEEKRFCSSECQHEAQKNRVERSCKNCDKQFETIVSDDHKYCSWGCRNEGIKRRVETECQWCGDEFEYRQSEDRKFCSVDCTENWFSSTEKPTSNGTGEDHWKYRDGVSDYEWYGPNWIENKRIAKGRVSCCEHPNCSKSDNLHCHHIVPFRFFKDDDGVDYESANSVDNLMMVCPKHHVKLDSEIRRVEEADGYDYSEE